MNSQQLMGCRRRDKHTFKFKGIAVRMMDVEEAELSVEKSGTGS